MSHPFKSVFLESPQSLEKMDTILKERERLETGDISDQDRERLNNILQKRSQDRFRKKLLDPSHSLSERVRKGTVKKLPWCRKHH